MTRKHHQSLGPIRHPQRTQDRRTVHLDRPLCQAQQVCDFAVGAPFDHQLHYPCLGSRQASEARRLTWLVDVFYDSRVKLVISAEVEADLLYTEGVQASEFFRTASRLTEMQSSAYLALAHRLAEESEPAA